MQLNATVLYVLLSLVGLLVQEPTPTGKSITREFERDVNSLLPAGKYTVDVMDRVIISPRRQELQEKMLLGMKANSEWYKQRLTDIQNGSQIATYDPRTGLTEPEWEELGVPSGNMSDMSVVASATESLAIHKGGEYHLFHL